jgi:hypothetical protein
MGRMSKTLIGALVSGSLLLPAGALAATHPAGSTTDEAWYLCSLGNPLRGAPTLRILGNKAEDYWESRGYNCWPLTPSSDEKE